MTIQEALARCDGQKPNAYSEAEKIRWLSDLDGLVLQEIIRTHENKDGIGAEYAGYDPEEAGIQSQTLLIPEPYSDVYIKYLFAQIDFANAEFARYNNSAMLYNTAYQAYANFYNRTHLPLQENRICAK